MPGSGAIAVVAATVRLGLSIWQSEKVARSNKASPTKKRSLHRAASKIVRIFSGSGDCPLGLSIWQSGKVVRSN